MRDKTITISQVLAVLLAVFGLLAGLARAEETSVPCTWGILNSEPAVPLDSVPVSARLTIHNPVVDPSAATPSLGVYLLDNPDAGLVALPAWDGLLEEYGTLLAILTGEDLANGTDVTIDLAQVNDPESFIWGQFSQPYTLTLGTRETVTYSSALLELIDCMGSGRSFGFALNPLGVSFSGLTLEIAHQSLTEGTYPRSLKYSVGELTGSTGGTGDSTGTDSGGSTDGSGGTGTGGDTEGDTGEATDPEVPANQPPVLEFTRAVTLTEKDHLTLPVLATDPDGDHVTVTAANLPEGASFDGAQLTWRTRFGDAGTYTISFTASDGTLKETDTCMLMVQPSEVPGRNK